MASCTFCAIAAGELPSSLVWRDELVLAFLDIQPRNPGHTLVVPRTHHPSLAALPETTGARMFLMAQRIASVLRQATVRCEAVSLALADGPAAGQEVPHVHLHVQPRFSGDDLVRPPKPTRAQLDRLAFEIAASLDANSGNRAV
ncbi:MAG: HIT family protein [Chloroflexota bacterium]|nr:HIT family protein [Chloroflexota bacterium]